MHIINVHCVKKACYAERQSGFKMNLCCLLNSCYLISCRSFCLWDGWTSFLVRRKSTCKDQWGWRRKRGLVSQAEGSDPIWRVMCCRWLFFSKGGRNTLSHLACSSFNMTLTFLPSSAGVYVPFLRPWVELSGYMVELCVWHSVTSKVRSQKCFSILLSRDIYSLNLAAMLWGSPLLERPRVSGPGNSPAEVPLTARRVSKDFSRWLQPQPAFEFSQLRPQTSWSQGIPDRPCLFFFFF